MLLSSPTHQPYMLYSWGGTAELGLMPGAAGAALLPSFGSWVHTDPFLSPLSPTWRHFAALPHPILHPPPFAPHGMWVSARKGGLHPVLWRSPFPQPLPMLCRQSRKKKSHCKTRRKESSSVWNLYGHSRSPGQSSPRQELHPTCKGDPPAPNPPTPALP